MSTGMPDVDGNDVTLTDDMHDEFWGVETRGRSPQVLLVAFVALFIVALVVVVVGSARMLDGDAVWYSSQEVASAQPAPVTPSVNLTIPQLVAVNVVDASTLVRVFAERLHDLLATTATTDSTPGTPSTPADERARNEQAMFDTLTRWSALIAPVAAMYPTAVVSVDGVQLGRVAKRNNTMVYRDGLTVQVRTPTQVCAVKVMASTAKSGGSKFVESPLCN
jgi:hypothetical protein